MDRRQALRILAAGTALQIAPRGRLLAALARARSLAASQAAPRTLNAHQFASVRTMAEMILPRTDTPGATDVGVSEFIDLVLTEWCDERERTSFLNGLADVDSRSRSSFGNDFVACSPAQQAEILTALGKKMEDDLKREPSRPVEGQPEADSNFYLMLRRLALTAYYNSEDGATQELDFQIIPDRHDGCAEIPSGKPGQESH